MTLAGPPRTLRSLLFAPGDDERKLRRALQSGADAVVADLEDAVAPSAKEDARELTRRVLSEPAGAAARLVRINAVGTPSFQADVDLLAELAPDAVVLPKATPEAADALAAGGLPVIAIVETAIGVRLAFETASRPHVFALLLGAVDLGAELRLQTRADGLEIHYARSKLVLDSAAAGIRAPIDVVHVAIDDLDGLARQAELARTLGLRGKAAIHPAQVATINDVFTPSPLELDWARRALDAAQAAAAGGRGVFNLDGSMVDAAVVLRAKRIVAESEGGSDER
jgi:citrate lyase subunit beta/citryl-CoA lyase